jgi:hypothetical protein
MHKFFTSIIIILLLCYTSGLTAQSMYSFEPADIEEKPEIKLEPKSHFWGAFYSVIPGLLFHGSGLFYVEKPGTGFALMGLEALSVLIIGFAYVDYTTIQPFPPPHDTPIDGPVDNGDNSKIYAAIGIGLFAATWIYDVVMTQKSIHEHNEFIKHRGFSLDIGTLEKSDGRTLTFGFSWRF